MNGEGWRWKSERTEDERVNEFVWWWTMMNWRWTTANKRALMAMATARLEADGDGWKLMMNERWWWIWKLFLILIVRFGRRRDLEDDDGGGYGEVGRRWRWWWRWRWWRLVTMRLTEQKFETVRRLYGGVCSNGGGVDSNDMGLWTVHKLWAYAPKPDPKEFTHLPQDSNSNSYLIIQHRTMTYALYIFFVFSSNNIVIKLVHVKVKNQRVSNVSLTINWEIN
jgi:hypothetical protein